MEVQSQSEFYLVGGAARALNVCEQTVRDWEREGKLRGTRTENGFRLFTSEEIARVKAERELEK